MDESLLNFSRVETDPFAGVPAESNVTETWPKPTALTLALSYAFVIAELANFFLGIAAVVSDVLLIYFIFRYKRLRKHINLYIANYAIMNMCYYVIAPIVLILHVLFSLGHGYFYHMFCYITMIEHTFQISTFFFIVIMGLEWTFSVVKPRFPHKIPAVLGHKYLTIYMVILPLLILTCAGCFLQSEILQSLPFFSMPFVVFSLPYMHFVRRKKVLNEEQLKTEYALWICTIAVACFVPMFILDLMLIILGEREYHIFIAIVFLLEYILSLLSTPSPIFILYYLIKWNKHFKMAFDTTFKRSVRDYGADNLDDASDNEEIVQDGREKNVESGTNGFNRSDIMVL